MKPLHIAIACLLCFASSGLINAADPAKQVYRGWRGDGTGRFPDANPPVKWSKISRAMLSLSCQASKPTGRKGEHSLADGVAREWLVLGPFDAKDLSRKTCLDKAFVSNEADLKPVEGDKSSGKTWKKWNTDYTFIDPEKTIGESATQKAIYLYTNIHSKQECLIRVVTGGACYSMVRPLVNGEESKNSGVFTFKKGWNRLLIKFVSYKGKQNPFLRKPYLGVTFWAADPQPKDFVTENMLWWKKLPCWGNKNHTKRHWKMARAGSVAQVVIAGDKLYTTIEAQSLVCFNKMTGKLLWMRSDNFVDVARDTDWKKEPGIAAEVKALNKRIKQIDALLPKREPTVAEIEEKNDAEKKIFQLMDKLDRKRFEHPKEQDAGIAGQTPCTDGTHVYVWYSTGVTVCYDLDGKLKWRYHNPVKRHHHGHSASPILSGNALITFWAGESGRDMQLVAHDKSTGKVIWHTKGEKTMSAFSTPLPLQIGGKNLVALEDGSLLDPATGAYKYDAGGKRLRAVPSPIIFEDNKILTHVNDFVVSEYDLSSLTRRRKYQSSYKIPKSNCWLDKDYPNRLNDPASFSASPLYHDGRVYLLRTDGLLAAMNAADASVAYMQYLNTSGWAAGARGNDVSSPTLGGKHIYLFDGTGTCIVLESGPTYKEVARNRIEQSQMPNSWRQKHESFQSSPVFEGNRLYFKAEDHIYCIGKE